MEEKEFYSFLDLFEGWQDAVELTIQWKEQLDSIYDNGSCFNKKWIPSEKREKLERLLNQINDFKRQRLLSEVKSNLYNINALDRENYIKTVCSNFTSIYKYISPYTRDEREVDITLDYVILIRGKNLVNNIWDNYFHYNQKPSDFLSKYIIKCFSMLFSFFEELDIICMGFNIDIEYIQDKYNVRVRDERNYFSLEVDGGFSFEDVRKIESESKNSFNKIITIKKENTDQEENKDVKALPKKPYTSFQDIFISKNHYNKAIVWLKEKGFFNENTFLFQSNESAFLFKSLELFGYTKSLSLNERVNISVLIGKKYGRSSFNRFDSKKYNQDDMKNSQINIFFDLPKWDSK